MWQKCPVCEGSGKQINMLKDDTCSVCEGKKIINGLTGKPPIKEEPEHHF